MSSLGKGTRSIRKKDLQTQKSIGVGVKKLVFYHKANSGDTTIDLTSLSMPSELSTLGKTNPSAAAIAGARIYFFQDNFTLISSLKGVLMPGSYVVTSSTQIQLQYTAAANEIFIGYVDNIIQTGLRAVDARVTPVTTTLAVGSTDVTYGDPFVTNLYPTQQIGAVMVFRNGKLQMRNTNNATASLTADGNYQEVPTVGATGNLIRFNIPAPGPSADSIIIVSNGALVERPTDSQMAFIETLAGQINSMVPVLADTAGVPTSTFGSNPSSVDLRTFGDTVVNQGTRVTALELGSQYNFSARATSSQTQNYGSGWFTTVYQVKDTDSSNMMNAATGVATVQKTGNYLCHGQITVNATSMVANNQFGVRLLKNGVTTVYQTRGPAWVAGTSSIPFSVELPLNLGDTIEMQAELEVGTGSRTLDASVIGWVAFNMSYVGR